MMRDVTEQRTELRGWACGQQLEVMFESSNGFPATGWAGYNEVQRAGPKF